jgi:hypothetical protein
MGLSFTFPSLSGSFRTGPLITHYVENMRQMHTYFLPANPGLQTAQQQRLTQVPNVNVVMFLVVILE